jgi:hypothetical protein
VITGSPGLAFGSPEDDMLARFHEPVAA